MDMDMAIAPAPAAKALTTLSDEGHNLDMHEGSTAPAADQAMKECSSPGPMITDDTASKASGEAADADLPGLQDKAPEPGKTEILVRFCTCKRAGK